MKVNKIYNIITLGIIPVAVFLSPIFFALYFHKTWIYWLLFISWIPAAVGIIINCSVQIVNDPYISDDKYRECDQEEGYTTP